MNILSLFDGISCGQVALNRAGITDYKYFASEIEQTAIDVCRNNFPSTIHLGDVKTIDISSLPKIDLLIGGSPCQGFSSAGKQLNFEDPRSQLFFEFVKIKNKLNPRYFLLENVKMKKEWQDVITRHLGVSPVFINSSDFSAQNRQRLYWTNIPIENWTPKNIHLNDILESGWESDRNKSYCLDANYGKGSNLRRYFHRGSRQIVFKSGFLPDKPSIEDANIIGNNMKDKWRLLTPEECERLQTLPQGYTNGISNIKRYHAIGNGWTVDVIAHILKGIIDE